MTRECEDSLFVIAAFSLSNEVIKEQNCISHFVLICNKADSNQINFKWLIRENNS